MSEENIGENDVETSLAEEQPDSDNPLARLESELEKLRNLSSDGALIHGGEKLPEGSAITFCRKDLRVRARVAWVQGAHAGVAFDTPLEPAEVLRHIPRRESKPLPPQLFGRPAVSRHHLSAGERQWIQDWMTSNGVDRPGE